MPNLSPLSTKKSSWLGAPILLYIRSTLFLSVMLLSVPPFLPVALLARVLPFPLRFRIIRLWSTFVLWWLKHTCQLRYKVVGIDNLPATPAIVFSNHQSAWETLALQQFLPPFCWVLKRELLWVPFFGWALSLLEPIPIDRAAARKALPSLIREGAARLAAGRWVVIFPQGTRVAPGERRRYSIGGALLAEHAGVPVVPIAHNAGQYWSRRALLKFEGTITIVIGTPIETAGRKASAINAEAEEWIENTLANLPPPPHQML